MSDARDQTLRFRCPHCAVTLRGKRSDAGTQRRCPQCDQLFRIPRPQVRQPKTESAAKKTGTKAAAKTASGRGQPLVPVVCGVCSTRMYANLDQVGMSLKCPDCFTQNLIKAPREEAKPADPDMSEGFGYDMGPEVERTVHRSMGDEMMEEAVKVVERKVEEIPVLPDRPLLSGVFLFPLYARIFPVVLGMVLGWGVVLTLVKIVWDLQGHASLLAPFLLAGTGIILVLVTFPTLVMLQKMFENTASGDDGADCRPEGGLLAFIDWIGDVFPLGLAMVLSLTPGFILVKAFELPVVWYTAVAVFAWVCFPVLYLSMLETASPVGLYSKAVWTSFRQLFGAWFVFYVISLLLFAGLAAAAIGIVSLAELEMRGRVLWAGGGCLVAIVAILSIQFRLMGRLAFLMSRRIIVDADLPEESPDSSDAGGDAIDADAAEMLGT